MLGQAAPMFLHDGARDGRALVATTDPRSRVFFRGEGDSGDRELSWRDYTMAQDLSADGRTIVLPGFGVDAAGLTSDGKTVWFQGADGDSLFACRLDETPARVFRVRFRTGARELLHEITPDDRTGMLTDGPGPIVSRDGKSYVYTTTHSLTDLHLVEGLR